MSDTQAQLLYWLQAYYQNHCNGDWEHANGIRIHTLDNPGWRVQISLRDTELAEVSFERQHIEPTATDWYHCWRDAEYFHGAGGVSNLVSILSVFRAWVEATDVSQTTPDEK